MGSESSIFGFTSQQMDSYIKLIDLCSRIYDPATGTFLTKDSWQGDDTTPMSYNAWLYVDANPINFTDPSGLDPNCKQSLSICAFQRLQEIKAQSQGAYALFRLFEDNELSDSWGAYTGRTTRQRLEWLLKVTQGGTDNLAKVNPILNFGIDFGGNTGFALAFRDDQFYPIWGLPKSDSNQVGHFLTAVDVIYNHWSLGFLIGHEQYSDTNTLLNYCSYLFVNNTDLDHWGKAVIDDIAGDTTARDQELWPILHFAPTIPFGEVDRNRQGNSLQNLRLSLKGYRFAHRVEGNANQPASTAGPWLRTNIGIGSR